VPGDRALHLNKSLEVPYPTFDVIARRVRNSASATRGNEEWMGQEVPHTRHGGYVPPLGLCRSPCLAGLILPHIFGKSLDKGIAKAEIMSISTMAIVLLGSFTKSVCKMWVKDSLAGMGCFTVLLITGFYKT
jgi:hypothetical protein